MTFFSGSQGHAGHVGHVVFFEKKIVSRSQGHVGHVVFFVGKFCFWVTGSRGYTKLGHVCDPEDYSTQIHKIGSRM